MFWAAFAQAFLSATGIALIWRTLVQTRRAADAAAAGVDAANAAVEQNREAIRHSEEGARAARDAVEVAQDTSRRELRAYIGTAGTSFFLNEKDPHAIINIHNFGQTPARAVVVRAGISVGTHIPEPRQYIEPPSYFGVLEPTHPVFVKAGCLPGGLAPLLGGLRRHETWLFVYGIIDYVDTFGRPQWRTFSFHVTHRNIDAPNPITLTNWHTGNDASED